MPGDNSASIRGDDRNQRKISLHGDLLRDTSHAALFQQCQECETPCRSGQGISTPGLGFRRPRCRTSARSKPPHGRYQGFPATGGALAW
jgi:hypothetical protein